MEEGGIEGMCCSQNDFCFDAQYLPVKNTDFIFFRALYISLPNSTSKEEGEHCWGISRKYTSIVKPDFLTLGHENGGTPFSLEKF